MPTKYTHTNLIAKNWKRLSAFSVDDDPGIANAIFERGGSSVSELIVREIPGAGVITFQYVSDPEGNILEIQSWKKTT